MSDRAFVIHGWQSHPDEGWIPWLNNELSSRGIVLRTPEMPNTDRPKCIRWVEELQKMVTDPDRRCHFIGHSLGCPAILRYIETLPPETKVGTVILVSGFAEDIGIPELTSFCEAWFDFETIRSRARKFISIHSDADEYISQPCFERLKDNLDATDIVVPGGGHLSASGGYFQLPQCLNAFLDSYKQ